MVWKGPSLWRLVDPHDAHLPAQTDRPVMGRPPPPTLVMAFLNGPPPGLAGKHALGIRWTHREYSTGPPASHGDPGVEDGEIGRVDQLPSAPGPLVADREWSNSSQAALTSGVIYGRAAAGSAA